MQNNFRILEESQYEAILEELKGLRTLIITKGKEEAEYRWLESEEARKLVGVSPKTWQIWRNNREIPFSQFMRKIWYKRSDIEAFLQDRYVQAKKSICESNEL